MDEKGRSQKSEARSQEPEVRTPEVEGNGDPEAEGRGLLLVELLELPRRFAWRRYRADLGGFLLAWGFVAALMLLLIVIAKAG